MKSGRPEKSRLSPVFERRAIGVLALVFLVIVSQFGALLHLAAGRHAICPEHGELVHVDVHEVAPEHAGLGDAPSVNDPAGPISSDDHDHCALAVHRIEAALCPQAVVLRAPPAPAVASAVGVPVERVRAPGVATYLLAPKQSPPV